VSEDWDLPRLTAWFKYLQQRSGKVAEPPQDNAAALVAELARMEGVARVPHNALKRTPRG